MSYLGGSIAFLWGQVQLWTGRANNAWGATRVWNSGTSFESDVATWQARANQAYDSGVWGSGSLWSADAHSDPAVYTNRFNAGVASAQPPAGVLRYLAAASAGGINGNTVTISWAGPTDNSLGGTNGTTGVTVNKAGAYTITADLQYVVGGNSGDTTTIRILVNGTAVDARSIPMAFPNGQMGLFAYYQGSLSATDVVSVQASNSFDTQSLVSGLLAITFIPTQANPH